MTRKQIISFGIVSFVILLVIAYSIYLNYYSGSTTSSTNISSNSIPIETGFTEEATPACTLPNGSVMYDPLRCEKVKTFRSKKLGVEFQVHESANVIEEANRIYINGKDSQFIEIFYKDAKLDVVEKVRQLNGPSDRNCTINAIQSRPEMYSYPATYTMISVSAHETDMDRAADGEPLLCQSKYVAFNGMASFITDSENPTKLAFLSIGQYSEPAGEIRDWQETFRFVR